MTDNEMFVKLSGEVAGEVRNLSKQFHYDPTELVHLGLGTVRMLMREKELGHKFFVTTADGKMLQEWVLPEPQSSIDKEAQRIVEGAFPTSLQKSIAALDPDIPKGKKKVTGPSADL